MSDDKRSRPRDGAPMKTKGTDIPALEKALDGMTPAEWSSLIPMYERQLAKAVESRDVEKALRVARILVELGGRRVTHTNDNFLSRADKHKPK